MWRVTQVSRGTGSAFISSRDRRIQEHLFPPQNNINLTMKRCGITPTELQGITPHACIAPTDECRDGRLLQWHPTATTRRPSRRRPSLPEWASSWRSSLLPPLLTNIILLSLPSSVRWRFSKALSDSEGVITSFKYIAAPGHELVLPQNCILKCLGGKKGTFFSQVQLVLFVNNTWKILNIYLSCKYVYVCMHACMHVVYININPLKCSTSPDKNKKQKMNSWLVIPVSSFKIKARPPWCKGSLLLLHNRRRTHKNLGIRLFASVDYLVPKERPLLKSDLGIVFNYRSCLQEGIRVRSLLVRRNLMQKSLGRVCKLLSTSHLNTHIKRGAIVRRSRRPKRFGGRF